MEVASHLDKFRRLSRLRARLEPLDDFELWYWTTLTVGTAAYNASLHLTGATEPTRAFSTIPGLYVVPQPDGSCTRELLGLGDVSHVDWPPVPGDLDPRIRAMEAALHELEKYRDPCLRGDRRPDAAVAADCDARFGCVTELLTAITEEAL